MLEVTSQVSSQEPKRRWMAKVKGKEDMLAFVVKDITVQRVIMAEEEIVKLSQEATTKTKYLQRLFLDQF
jgi:hypothetical protein